MKFRFSYILVTIFALGGTTVNAAQNSVSVPNALQQQSLRENLTQEEARQAILKMAGEYQVTFRFEETYPIKADYNINPPDISKGFETVIVLENTANKISLQHLLMVGNHVVKHWRQDWTYEPTTMWTYIGHYQWKKVQLSPEQSQGKWLQTVWQVDDSPRYAGLGHWIKDHGIESWSSDETYRPLPRRELTTRDDYDVISGINRQTITAEGWVHEQDNIKYDSKSKTPLVRELGMNTYIRVTNTDFKPAYAYWDKNKAYWGVVRSTWDKALKENDVLGLRFTRQKDDDKEAHYMHFIKQAKIFEGKNTSEKQLNEATTTLLNEELTLGKIRK